MSPCFADYHMMAAMIAELHRAMAELPRPHGHAKVRAEPPATCPACSWLPRLIRFAEK